MLWSSNFEVGIKTIDDEHHVLVDMITKLQASLTEGLVSRQMGLVIKELVNYTKFHFSSEEKIMKQIHYPLYEEHKILHENLVIEVIKILKYLKVGKPINSIDLIDFLQIWLNDHIIHEDKKIGLYYSNNRHKILLNE